MKFFTLFCFAFTTNLAFAAAAETPKKKLISFEGFVQFSEGSSSVVSLGGEKESVKYGTPIYEDTRVKVENGAILKFVTKQNCVVVVYGEGGLSGPQAEKAWMITTRAARFLCSEKNEEKFNFHGVEIIPQGETLFDMSGKIFVVTGSAKLSKVLVSRKIYQLSKNVVSSDVNLQSPQAQYDFDNLYKVPREGERLVKPKVIAPIKNRVSFGPEFGPAIMIHANGYLNHYDYNSGGPRLQLSFRNHGKAAEDGAYILGFRYLSTENNKNNGNYNNNNGAPNYSSATDRLRTFGIDGGYRFNFDRWWSPFVHLGLTWMRDEIYISTNSTSGSCGPQGCGGYNSDLVLDYFGLSAGFGYDMLYRPSWLGGVGFLASAELELNQTVHPTTGSVRSLQNSSGSVPNEATNEHGLISNLNALFHVGLMYQW